MVVINNFLKEGIFPEDLNSFWYSKKIIMRCIIMHIMRYIERIFERIFFEEIFLKLSWKKDFRLIFEDFKQITTSSIAPGK